MKWFRLYDDLLDDPKAQRLPPILFKRWINLLCLASKSEPRGMLPPIEDIAFRLRIEVDEAQETIAALKNAGLLDESQESGEYPYQPHNWIERQKASDDIAERVAKHRAAKKTLQPKDGENDVTLQKRYSNGLDVDKRREDTEREKTTPPSPPKGEEARKSARFVAPTAEEAREFFASLNAVQDAQQFFDFYVSKGWKVGTSPMRDWRAAARNWVARRKDNLFTNGGNRGSPRTLGVDVGLNEATDLNHLWRTEG